MYVDGKPLLVVFNCYFTEKEWKEYQKTNATPYMDQFTVRFSTGHVYEGNYGQWGWVMPDGNVSNSKGASAGHVMPDGTVVDLGGQTVARVAPYTGFAIKNACSSVGEWFP